MLYASVLFDPVPVINHVVPFQATPVAPCVNRVGEIPGTAAQFIPSELKRMGVDELTVVAVHTSPFHATPVTGAGLVLTDLAFCQVIPSYEYPSMLEFPTPNPPTTVKFSVTTGVFGVVPTFGSGRRAATPAPIPYGNRVLSRSGSLQWIPS